MQQGLKCRKNEAGNRLSKKQYMEEDLLALVESTLLRASFRQSISFQPELLLLEYNKFVLKMNLILKGTTYFEH